MFQNRSLCEIIDLFLRNMGIINKCKNAELSCCENWEPLNSIYN